MTEDSRYIEKIPKITMTHTDTDIAEIVQRFDEEQKYPLVEHVPEEGWGIVDQRPVIKDFITRECLALKKKWEREHFDNQ